jgi:hypothetical protein
MLPRCSLFVGWCLLLQTFGRKKAPLSFVDAWSSRSDTGSSSTHFLLKPNPPDNLPISNRSYKPFTASSHQRRIAEATSVPPIYPKSQVSDEIIFVPKASGSAAAAIFFAVYILFSAIFSIGATPLVVLGYDGSQYISDTVKVAIQAVQEASSTTDTQIDALVKAYENIAEIITEGKGVGGAINFQGVQLDRGFVSDEDTTIYNPGLTLLTETEKDSLVNAIVESKQQVINSNNVESWSNDLEAGYSFLRQRLDPLHMYELRGYLSILPWYGAVMYLVALAVQLVARDTFPIAYIVCAAAVLLPIAVLVILGA